MSGGRFGYYEWHLEDAVQEIENVLESYESGEEPEQWDEETIQNLKDGIAALKRAYIYSKKIDYFLSGDSSEKSFNSGLKKALEELDNNNKS